MRTKKTLRILSVVAMVLCLVMAFSMTAFADTTTNAAAIGETEYATLAEAVDAVGKNAGETTITLLKDQTISGQMIGKQYVQNIVLDLGGHTLSSNGITLTSYRSGTTLTIQNGTVIGNNTSGTLRGTYGGQLILGEKLIVKGAGGSATLVYLDNGKLDIAVESGVEFTGGKLDLKQSANVNNKMNVVSIGRTYFGALENAFAAAKDGDTIKVEGNIALDKMITNTKKVTLDLNGKTITGTDNTSKNFSLIDNRSELTITGNGTMTLTATVNSGWSRYSAVIANNPGGKLTVESGVIEHLGGTDMAYGIDNLTNGKGTYAETIINGGTIKSTYRAIRQFLNGVEAQNILTINGGTVEGANKSVWMQDPSANANSGTLTVTEDAALKGDVYLFVTAGSTEWPVEVSIASAALQEGSEVVTGNIPETYVVENVNGTYGVKEVEASIGEAKYETLSAAISAAQAGNTIKVLGDIELGEMITNTKEITLDLNGKTVSYTSDVAGEAMITNNGDLTITGDGKIVYTYTGAADSAYSKGNYTINNNGKLTIDGATVENATASMKHAYYTVNNGNGGEVIMVEGLVLNTTNYAVRMFGNGSLTVNGGEIKGTRAVWMQAPGSDANTAPAIALTVNGGKLTAIGETGYKLAVYSYSYGNSLKNVSINITGGELEGDIALSGGQNQTVAETVTITGGTITDLYSYADDEVAEKTVNVSGGTFANALNDAYCAEGFVPADNGDGTYGVKEVSYVASIGEAKYETLAAAIKAAQAGNTITFLADVNENVTINKNLTIDGADKNYTGKMTLNASLNVTIQNVNFVKGYVDELGGAHGYLTIKNCSFDGVDKSIGYAISQRGGDKLTIENSTAKNYSYGMLYIPSAVTAISVKDVEVENCTAAFNISYSGDGTFENVELNNVTYGLHVQNYGARTFTLKGCNFNCKYPIYVDNKSTATVTFKFEGENTFVTETAYTSKYAKLILAENAVLTAPELFTVTTNVEDYEVVYNNGAYSLVTGNVRIVNGAIYDTLAEAIEAAKTGDTVKLLKDISVDADDLVDLDGYNTFFKVEEKSITVDLNGKTITADASAVTDGFVVGVFSVANHGELTLTGEGTVQGYSGENEEAAYLDPTKGNSDYNYKFYSLLASYNEGATIIIEDGNYILDFAGDSLAYSSGNEGVVVNGGTFKLGNLGGIRNGMPWVFNARGQNVRHVVVNGGSFCADIQHQYYPFEVKVPENLALKYENGMYTVVDAVAYVTEREWSSAWYTNKVGYATLEEAIAACEGPKTRGNKTSEQEVVVLLKDITLEENATIVISKPVSIDLAKHTIYGVNTRTNTHNFLIDVKGGILTASNGTIAMKHTGENMGWNGATTVIDVTAGGVLNLNGVTVQNQGGTDMNFAVHMNNWGAVTLNANNCVFDATYCGVRVFNSGYDMNNVTITNSKLTGNNRAFWVHNYLGDLDSTKHSDEAIKARLNLDIYNNGNTFEITGEAKSPIRYGFGNAVYFNGNGAQVVDSAEELQDAINNGSSNIILGGDINLDGSITIN